MYSITVKIEGIESRRRSAGILHVVIGLFLIAKGADYYKYTQFQNFIPVVPALLMGSFSLFYGLFRKKIDLTYRYNYWLRLFQVLTFTLLGVMMLSVGRPLDYIGIFVFVFLSIILLFSERKIFQETTIFLDDNGVKIPGYYRDHLILWSELSNVVIREDFVTFFHVREKYLQYQVIQDLSTLEVAKMNAFCREKIGFPGKEANDEEDREERKTNN
jgi:hypothetical protein